MTKPVCAVVGVGPGNGAAFARRFSSEGYAVALLARSTKLSEELAATLPDSRAYACDVTDPNAIEQAFSAIRNDLGEVDTLLYNAGSGVFGDIEQVSADDLETAWRINTLGSFLAARQVIPAMKKAQKGNIIFTGATASLRGGANFAAFASAKAAQRNLAQSMARHLGSSGIHVALLIVDGMIDLPRTRQMMPDAPDERFLNPDDIAETVFNISQQKPSAWSFETDVRPYTEKW